MNDSNHETSHELPWTQAIELLVEKEGYATWNPFPERFVNTGASEEYGIVQMQPSNPPIKIVYKMTENFAALQQYEFDEDALPPKVVTWNDISSYDSKTATKIVRTGAEKEYHSLTDDFEIVFQNVSADNNDPLPINLKPNDILIYHIIDPTLNQNPKVNEKSQAQTAQTKMSRSKSSYAAFKIKTKSVLTSPIHEDTEALRNLCMMIPTSVTPVFILDCPYAKRAGTIIHENIPKAVIFGATSESLHYTPQLPCDLFTSCMLTPAQVALLWQSQLYSDIRSGILSDIDIQTLIDSINDSSAAPQIIKILEICLQSIVNQMLFKTFRDNAIITKAFRSVPILNKLLTNYVFATRILKSFSMTPFSFPEIPTMDGHLMWDAFDVHVDEALYVLRESLKPNPQKCQILSDTLEDQLNRLENWMCFPKKDRPPPDELQYIDTLLLSKQYFSKTIHFCAKFLKISVENVVSFLRTRALSAILPLLADKEFMDHVDPEVDADLSYVIVNCLLVNPRLAMKFEIYADFWIKRVECESEDLKIASLCCLLHLAKLPGKIELYKERFLSKILEKTATDQTSVRVRTLSHLLLAVMGIGMSVSADENELAYYTHNEQAPMARAAIIHRVNVTLDTVDPSSVQFKIIWLDIINACNDLSQLVREEALVALAHAISLQPPDVIQQINSQLTDQTAVENSLIIPLIGELTVMQYDPSLRASIRLNELMVAIDKTIRNSSKPEPIVSNLNNSCLRRIAQSQTFNTEPLAFFEGSMTVQSATLEGTPTISPSGLLGCGDTNGIFHIQWEAMRSPQQYSLFSSKFDPLKLPPTFQRISSSTASYRPRIAYSEFIDDSHVIVVSDRSQVVVINHNIKDGENEASFWLSSPDIEKRVLMDYNTRSHQVLHHAGMLNANIYDMGTLRLSSEVHIGCDRVENMEWLKDYSDLFYVAQKDLMIFDKRVPRGCVAVLKDVGRNILSCNSSGADPYFLFAGYRHGYVSRIDMRQMVEDASIVTKSPLRQFDVHKHLPYAVGLTETMVKFVVDNDGLSTERQNVRARIDAFALHPNETACCIRCGNIVSTTFIDYVS